MSSRAEQWQQAVGLGALGRYAEAWAILDSLAADPGVDPDLASLSRSTSASLLRQIGRHDLALPLDELAAEPPGLGPEAGVDAWVGLAADAIGIGDAPAARARLRVAGAVPGPGWRGRVRILWVTAELALLEDDPVTAEACAADAVAIARHSGSARHVAKGLLIQGVAAAARPADAAGLLRASLDISTPLGLLPLQWPAWVVLAATERDDSHLRAAGTAVMSIASHLPGHLRAPWLDRPDLRALPGVSAA